MLCTRAGLPIGVRFSPNVSTLTAARASIDQRFGDVRDGGVGGGLANRLGFRRPISRCSGRLFGWRCLAEQCVTGIIFGPHGTPAFSCSTCPFEGIPDYRDIPRCVAPAVEECACRAGNRLGPLEEHVCRTGDRLGQLFSDVPGGGAVGGFAGWLSCRLPDSQLIGSRVRDVGVCRFCAIGDLVVVGGLLVVAFDGVLVGPVGVGVRADWFGALGLQRVGDGVRFPLLSLGRQFFPRRILLAQALLRQAFRRPARVRSGCPVRDLVEMIRLVVVGVARLVVWELAVGMASLVVGLPRGLVGRVQRRFVVEGGGLVFGGVLCRAVVARAVRRWHGVTRICGLSTVRFGDLVGFT
ncbi:hypothetical protein FrEUN1fDRAFT_6386 [Parafrankia sp. EUN1f]|nr:hypothetical protein FrEUN1fDRAFT_6386 [Parafrankia sp. EUN1f]